MQLSVPSWGWGCALLVVTSLAYGETLSESLQRCAVEKDKAARLACYDEVAVIAAAPAAPRNPEAQFGVTGELLRKQEEQAAKEAADLAKVSQISARVTEVKTRRLGQLVVELDNGQAWEQKDASAKFFVKVGEQVKVESGTLGAFWLQTESGRRTRVKRIR